MQKLPKISNGVNQAFSKIWIPVILIIVFVSGIFAWQYFRVEEKVIPEEDVIIPEKRIVPVEEKVKEFFRVAKPELNQRITSAIQIKGEAKLPKHEVMNEWISIKIIDKNGHHLGRGRILTKEGKIEGFFVQEVFYEQPTSRNGLIKIYEFILNEEFVPTEGGLRRFIPKTLKEIPVVFGEKLLIIPNNWKVYDNPKANFTFRYPPDWKITADFLYITPGGAKAVERTIAISYPEERHGILINMPQIPRPVRFREVSQWNHENFIATFSKDPETLAIYEKVVSSFRIVK